MKRAALAVALALLAGPALAQEPNTNAAKITNSSANVANATATATLAASPGLMNYLCGFAATGSGATAGLAVTATVTGLNGGTMNVTVVAATGAALANSPVIMNITPCQPATALNTAITLSVPAFGTGNTNSTANIWGYRLPY